MHFEDKQLDCGIRLVHAEHDVPFITSRLRTRAGHEYDPIGKEGTTHLLEHVLYAGTTGYDYKGTVGFNAWMDVQPFFIGSATTNIHFIDVPSTGTQQEAGNWISFLASFVCAPSFAQDFESERDVVRAERRDRHRSDRSKAMKLAEAKTFGYEEHRRMTANGLPDDDVLDAITLEDLRATHGVHFHPHNMTFVSAGSISSTELASVLEEAFLPFNRPWDGIPRLAPLVWINPPLKRENRFATIDGGQPQVITICYNWRFTRQLSLVGSVTRHALDHLMNLELRERLQIAYGVKVEYSRAPSHDVLMISCRIHPKHEEAARAAIERLMESLEGCEPYLARVQHLLTRGLVMRDITMRKQVEIATNDISIMGAVLPPEEMTAQLRAVSMDHLTAFVWDRLTLKKAYIEIVEDS